MRLSKSAHHNQPGPEHTASNQLASSTPGVSELFTIGVLAQLCNVTVRTLRYYEQMDLIGPVSRTDSRYRLYNQHSLKRLKAILALQDLGYSLEDILVTLGPFSKRQDFNRRQQVEQSKRSLRLQQESVDKKLQQLGLMKEDIQQRLGALEEICHPCVDHQPDNPCPDSCAYLHMHD